MRANIRSTFALYAAILVQIAPGICQAESNFLKNDVDRCKEPVAFVPNFDRNAQNTKRIQHTPGAVWIRQPGCYYLSGPFVAEGVSALDRLVLSGFDGATNRSGHIISTTGASILIDLNGFSLKARTGASGILGADAIDIRMRGRDDTPMPPDQIHRVTIRNGTIELSERRGRRTGDGVLLPSDQSKWCVHSSRNPCPLPTSYRKVEYILENLTLKVDGVGASLMGDGIVIRNCTIEVEGENALVVYGPNAIIENNHIVYRFSDANPGLVTATYPKAPGRAPEIRSAIYLRKADNAVVRGNTISIDWRDSPVSAVALIDSLNVNVEGNSFNTDKPVALNGKSSAIMKDNSAKKTVLWMSKTEKLPDGVLE
jgi:hypothetical protein